MRQGAFAAVALTVVAIAVGGCGGDDSDSSADDSSSVDGAALVDPFDAIAAQAYEDAGKNREEDFASGTTLDGCPIADDEAASAIAEAAALDELVFSDGTFIQGEPGIQENMICSVETPSGAEHPTIVNVAAGTTSLTRDQALGRLLQIDEGSHEVDGEAPGLDPDSVIAVEGGGVSRFIWIDGDFQIGVSGASDLLDTDQGLAALSAAVDGVSRTLTD